MVQILLFLANHCAFLFRPSAYRFVDSRVDDSFGGDAMVILESTHVRLRFTWDRAQLLMEFQPAKDCKEWFSPGLLRGFLTGDRGGPEVLDRSWAGFLETSIPELESRLADPGRARELISGLRREGRKRASELFG